MDDRDEMETQETAITQPAEALSQFFGSTTDVVYRYQHCVICNGNLHFSHLTDFNKNLTEETARCPECGIRARHVMHRLQ